MGTPASPLPPATAHGPASRRCYKSKPLGSRWSPAKLCGPTLEPRLVSVPVLWQDVVRQQCLTAPQRRRRFLLLLNDR